MDELQLWKCSPGSRSRDRYVPDPAQLTIWLGPLPARVKMVRKNPAAGVTFHVITKSNPGGAHVVEQPIAVQVKALHRASLPALPTLRTQKLSLCPFPTSDNLQISPAVGDIDHRHRKSATPLQLLQLLTEIQMGKHLSSSIVFSVPRRMPPKS